MHVRRSLLRFAALLTAGLVLTSCGSDDPEPKFEAEPSPSTSASTSPSPSATAEQESAKEFIRRWVDEANSMQADGQVDEFLAMSPRCEGCATIAHRVRSIYKSGGYIKTDGWTIHSISPMGRTGASATYEVRVTSAPTEYQEAAGGAIESYDGGPRKYQMNLSRRGTEWRLDEYLDMGR